MKRILPPRLFAGTAAAMAAASVLIPGPTLVSGPVPLVGLAFGTGGVLVTVGGSNQFRVVGTNIKPFDDPDQFVTDGLFAWSRNPMYLGFGSALVGLAVGLGSTTPWIGPAAFVWIVDRIYVRFEEERMTAVFGREFDQYRSQVYRWVGRRRASDRADEVHNVR